MLNVPRVPVLAFAALMLAIAPAAAHGHGGGHGGFHHGGGFHGGGFHHFHGGFHAFGAFGFGPYFGYPYRYPYYYNYSYPYPYSYDYAPGAYVLPSPLYSVPVPGQCRLFQGDAMIAGTNQPFYGTACWQSDGAWHIAP